MALQSLFIVPWVLLIILCNVCNHHYMLYDVQHEYSWIWNNINACLVQITCDFTLMVLFWNWCTFKFFFYLMWLQIRNFNSNSSILAIIWKLSLECVEGMLFVMCYNMVVLMVDSWFKNLQLIIYFMGLETITHIVTMYDHEVSMPLLMIVYNKLSPIAFVII